MFIDRSASGDTYREIYQQALKQLRANPDFAVRIVQSFSQAEALLYGESQPFSVIILWLSAERQEEQDRLFQLLESVEHDMGAIVVFGFDGDTQAAAREVMLRDAYAFACPFNPAVLSAYVEASNLFVQSTLQLDRIEKRLWTETSSIQEIVDIVLEELRGNPLIGYSRATIDLIDTRDNKRYPLRRANYLRPNREMKYDLDEDILMQRVGDEGVVIISDLERLREQPGQLQELGWEDTSSTRDICSWIGMILEYKGEQIGLITLDHTTPGHYARYGDRVFRYLETFRRIVGEAIAGFYEQRNARVLTEAITAVGQELQGRELIRVMLLVIRDGIGAANCTFFRAESSIDNDDTYLRAWVRANSDPHSPEPQEQEGRIFKRGEALAGNVLADGVSRIVPHALENLEFRATPYLSGVDLSMLLVPMVITLPSAQGSQIIGVISAYRSQEPDYFTPYDRDLIETIARQVALTIQRTLVLENIAVVSAEINRLLRGADMNTILRNICEHVLRATTATEAVIHRLRPAKPDGTDDRKVLIENYWYPESGFRKSPRLNGTGATDAVLRNGKLTRFSVVHERDDRLAPELIERGVKHVLGVPLQIDEGKDKEIIGVLFLNKYAPEPFSTIEEFAVSLFANEAANTIHTLESFSGLKIWSRGNENLIKAIRSITRARNRAEVLHNIVLQAHTLVNASFSYITLRNERGTYEFQAAWPEWVDADLREKIGYFDYVGGTPKRERRKGVTALAARDKRSYLIADIKRELEDPDSEAGREYIDFGLESGCELAVPIIAGEDVLGVINLEHRKANALTKVHQEVIELFAEQAASALQTAKNYQDSQRQTERLAWLLSTLQDITHARPDEILARSLNATPAAIGAEAIIWMPIATRMNSRSPRQDQVAPGEGEGSRLYLRVDEIATNSHHYYGQIQRLAELDPTSEQVFRTRRSEWLRRPSEDQLAQGDNGAALPPVLHERGVHTAICLPLLVQHECIGVVWFDFGKEPPRVALSTEVISILQIYVNQIALAYTSAKNTSMLRERVQQAHTGITADMNKHYREVRWQSLLYFGVALMSSVVGAGLVLFGGWQFFTTSTDAQWTGALTAVFGVIIEAVGVFVYTQARAAHERMDRYHQELYRIRQFDILLRAAEQLQADAELEAKRTIIGGALTHWLERASVERAAL